MLEHDFCNVPVFRFLLEEIPALEDENVQAGVLQDMGSRGTAQAGTYDDNIAFGSFVHCRFHMKYI